jgi:hypothetical protein
VSDFANRLSRVSVQVKNRLPELLVPQSDENEANRQNAELAQLGDDLLLLIRDLKNRENSIRAQGWGKFSDPWKTKDKLSDVGLKKEEAEALAREIKGILSSKGLNPMDVGYKVHELIENSEIQPDDAQRAIQGRTIHSSIGPATQSTVPHMTLHMVGSVVPAVTFACLLLRWAAIKLSAAKIEKNPRAS